MFEIQVLKKITISFFIVCFLWVTIYSNLNIILKTKIGVPPTKVEANFSSFVKISWSRFNYGLGWAGSFLAVKNVWNMFAVVDRSTWNLAMVGSDQNGNRQKIILPYSANKASWQDNFFNYREAKLFQNFNGNNYFQNLYAQYLCKKDPSLNSVEFSYTSNFIVPMNNYGGNKYLQSAGSTNFYLCQT